MKPISEIKGTAEMYNKRTHLNVGNIIYQDKQLTMQNGMMKMYTKADFKFIYTLYYLTLKIYH